MRFAVMAQEAVASQSRGHLYEVNATLLGVKERETVGP